MNNHIVFGNIWHLQDSCCTTYFENMFELGHELLGVVNLEVRKRHTKPIHLQPGNKQHI